MKNPPKLNDGKIYVVTLYGKSPGSTAHLGDYRTFEEALVVARQHGAIVLGIPDGLTLYGASLNTYQGGSIHIGVEFVDPIDKGEKP